MAPGLDKFQSIIRSCIVFGQSKTAKALTRPCGYIGLAEPLLFAYLISSLFSGTQPILKDPTLMLKTCLLKKILNIIFLLHFY